MVSTGRLTVRRQYALSTLLATLSLLFSFGTNRTPLAALAYPTRGIREMALVASAKARRCHRCRRPARFRRRVFDTSKPG